MPYCANCGAQYKEEANFCPECGEPVEKKEAEKESKPVKRRVGPEVKLGIFIMVVGFFIGWIGFQIGNQGLGFGGVRVLVIGLIIFIIAKWRNKKAFFVSGGIFVGMILLGLISSAWQNRSVEIKRITSIKCKICGEVISADTTVVERLYKDVKNKDFIYSYKDALCESCLAEGEKLYQEGRSEYAKGNYELAEKKFREANIRNYKDAEIWMVKAIEVQKREYAVAKAKEKAKIQAKQQAKQNKLAQYIAELKQKGLIYKIEKWSGGCDVYLGIDFYGLTIDQKGMLAKGIWAYYEMKDPDLTVIILFDKYSGKKIGRYSEYGLTLY